MISADIQYFINGVELRTTEELLRTRHDTYITWQYKVQIEYFKDNKRAMPRELPYASDFMSFSSSVHNTDYPANLYVMVHLPANELIYEQVNESMFTLAKVLKLVTVVRRKGAYSNSNLKQLAVYVKMDCPKPEAIVEGTTVTTVISLYLADKKLSGLSIRSFYSTEKIIENIFR